MRRGEDQTVMLSWRWMAAGAAALAMGASGGVQAQVRHAHKATAAKPAAATSDPTTAADNAVADAAAAADAPATVAPTGPQPMREQVAATVNDDVISTYDLRQRVRLLIISSGVQVNDQNLQEIEREALRALIDERLQRDEIASVEKRQKDIKLYPTEKEIDEDFGSYAKQFNVTPAQLVISLKNSGVDAKTLRDQISISTAWRRYIGGRFRDNVHVSDSQVSAALKRVEAEAARPQYLVSEAFLDASAIGGQPQAMQGADELIKQIRGGAPFSAVARQFSALPSAANGGDAGWLSTGEMKPVIQSAVERMRPGEVSDPIPTQDGVYIVQLREKRSGEGVTTLTLKQAAIRLAPDAPANQVTAAAAKLTALREAAGGCAQLQTASAKVPGVVSGDLGEVNPKNLSPEFQRALVGLKPGQIGGPVRSGAGLHLLAVCASQTGSATTTTRADIENHMYSDQLTSIERRYLRDLRNSAAIETR